METHVCRECGEEKDVFEFNRKESQGPYEPWNLRRCKACSRRQYEAMRARPKRRQKNMEAARNWKKKNPRRHAALAREYRKRHPEKIKAQNRLNYAIQKGRIKRQPCEICGTTEKVHAHHESYDPKDWYNVRWLCYVCHEIEHG